MTLSNRPCFGNELTHQANQLLLGLGRHALDQLQPALKSGADGRLGELAHRRQAQQFVGLESGADIRFIQAMLGHADLKSTQIYAHVAVKQLKAIHEATRPAKMRPAKAAVGLELLTADDLLAALEADGEAEAALLAGAGGR